MAAESTDARRYAKARAVFFQAVDLAPDKRRAFVDHACGGDDDLRREVVELLASLESDRDAFGDSGPGVELRSAAESVFDQADSDDELAPGVPRRIGRHDVKGCLGEGGMGVVYEAEQRQPRRRVAIKVLRPALVTPDLVQRFRREAELLGRLHHPGIAAVYEAGQARPWGRTGPELPYLVMELVNGQPITTHAAQKRLSVEEKLELVARTCDAIQHAHERGVVHRDLKPANVLVDESGRPRVLDFGVARAVDAEAGTARATRGDTSHLVGTLSYMSPEQLGQSAGAGGAACDVYALGVLAYELLAGRLPLQLAGLPLAEAIRRVQEVDPPRLGTIDRKLAGDVEAIVGKALEKDPARRYSSAAQLAADIRRHLAHEPILARPPGRLYRARKFARRHRSLVASTLATMLLLAGAGAISAALAVRATHARHEAEAASAEASRASYRALLLAAVAAMREGDAHEARAHLDAAPEDLREWTWRHLDAAMDDSLESIRSEVRSEARLTTTPWGVVAWGHDGLAVMTRGASGLRMSAHRPGWFAAVSPDGELAVERRDGNWLLHRTRDLAKAPTLLADAAGEANGVLAGGTWALHAREDCLLLPPDGAPQRLGLRPGDHGWMVIRASPDEHAIAAASSLELAIVRLGASGPTAVSRRPAARIADMAFTPDGSRLLAGDDAGRLRCMGLDAAATCGWDDLDTGRQRIACIRVDPKGRHFLTADRSGRVRTWSLATGEPLGLSANVGHDSARAFFSQDGDVVILPRGNGSVAFLTVEGRPAGSPRLGAEANVVDVACTSDTLTTLDADGVVRSFLPPGSADPHRLSGHSAYVYSAHFSPDGSTVASIGWDGTTRTWNASTGAPLATIRGRFLAGRIVRFLADGRRLATIQDGALVVLDVATGAELQHHDGKGFDLDVGSSRIAVVGYEGEIDQWDADGAKLVAQWPSIGGSPADARRICWSADGTRLFASAGALVKALDAATGKEFWSSASMVGDVLALARDPSGRLVAGACRDGAVTMWDASTGAVVREMRVPGGATLCLTFHPIAPELVTGSHDGSVQVWDVDRGEPIARLVPHEDYVRDVQFSPDGTMLVSASGDGTLAILDTVKSRARLGMATAGRPL